VAGGGRHRDEAEAEVVGGHLREVDRLPAAERDEERRLGRLGGADDLPDRVEARVVDRHRLGAVELCPEAVARQLVGRRRGDEQRGAAQRQLRDGRPGVVEHAVPDEDVPRELDPRGLREHAPRFRRGQ